MFWKIALFLLSAAAIGIMPYADSLGLPAGAALPLVFSIGLGLAASAGISGLAAAGGALGALSGAMLWPVSPVASGALLSALAFAERSSRIQKPRARLAHMGLAMAAGGASAALAQHYAFNQSVAQGWIVPSISLVVVAVLMQLPTLIEADDPLAHALSAYAACVSGPSRANLLTGAELRRTVVDVPLPRKDAREIKNAWATLLELSEARVRLERAAKPLQAAQTSAGESVAKSESRARAVAEKLDARIAAHVAALSRTFAAVDAASAAAVGLNDSALRHVESVGESLDQVSTALVDDTV